MGSGGRLYFRNTVEEAEGRREPGATVGGFVLQSLPCCSDAKLNSVKCLPSIVPWNTHVGSQVCDSRCIFRKFRPSRLVHFGGLIRPLNPKRNVPNETEIRKMHTFFCCWEEGNAGSLSHTLVSARLTRYLWDNLFPASWMFKAADYARFFFFFGKFWNFFTHLFLKVIRKQWIAQDQEQSKPFWIAEFSIDIFFFCSLHYRFAR